MKEANACGLHCTKINNISVNISGQEILKNVKNAKYVVTEVKKGERKRTPAPPFTTSTMQQGNFRRSRT